MNMKKIVTLILLVFVAVSITYLIINKTAARNDNTESSVTKQSDGNVVSDKTPEQTGDKPVADKNTSGDKQKQKIIVYYFHGNRRCFTCRKFEEYGYDILKNHFSRELESGQVEWRVINVDTQQDKKYYIDHYNLVTKSIVLSVEKNGKEIRWKNLDKIWELVRDKDVFYDYVRSELKDFISNGADANE